MRLSWTRRLSWLVIAAMVACAACGEDESPCEEFGKKLCDLACDCTTEGAECVVVKGTSAITLEDDMACRALYVSLGCMDEAQEDFDFAGCSDALDQTTCAESEDGQRGVAYPDVPACE